MRLESLCVHDALDKMERRSYYTREERLLAAMELGEWGMFSKYQIAAILDVDVRTISGAIRKTARTGGRFAPESLPHLSRALVLLKRRESAREPLRAAVEAGTSVPMVARLTGQHERSVRRWVA